MSAYKEFTGKTVEEALKAARDEFGAELNDLDFEILTPGSRGVLGHGCRARPDRRRATVGARRGRPQARRCGVRAAARPPAREFDATATATAAAPRRPRARCRDRDRAATTARASSAIAAPRRDDRTPAADATPRRDDGRGRAWPADRAAGADVSASEAAEVAAARGSLAAERADLEAAEASPEALAAGQRILETLMGHLGFDAKVEVAAGETSRLNVVAQGDDRDALGALIGRKGERLSALQHLVNLMLSKEMGSWTRVLVDVEDYRGRRERQLRELADRAAARVMETGKMLQLEPMPALERRWIHLTLRDHAGVATQSIGEEPNRRVVLVPRGG